MKSLAAYIMKGRMQAVLVASSLALLSILFPPVSVVSSAAVSLVTLRRGAREGLYILIAACVSAALLGLFLLGNFQFALAYGLALWLPVWLISIVLREGKHLSTAINISVLTGVAIIIGFYLFVSDPAAFWSSMLSQMAQPMIEAGNTDVPLENIQQSIQAFSHFMTGGIVVGGIYGLLFGLFLARWWQSALYNPGGFRQEYLALSVNSKIASGSLLVIAIGFLTTGVISELCWNIGIIFLALYTFVGTAIFHTVFSTMKMKRFMVPFLYITLVLVPHAIGIVAIVGLVDAWLDLRNKILNRPGAK